MHRVRSPLALSLAAILALAMGLSGCAPTSGTVTVDVRPVSQADMDWSLKVTIRDAEKNVVARQTMRAGQSKAFVGVPLGEVTVTAEGLCIVETTLTERGVQTIFEPLHCTI